MHTEYEKHHVVPAAGKDRRAARLSALLTVGLLPAALGCSLITGAPGSSPATASTNTNPPPPAAADTLEQPVRAADTPEEPAPPPQPTEGTFELSFDDAYGTEYDPNAGIDLDTMELGISPATDLQMDVSKGSVGVFIELIPQNGAKGISMGAGSVSPADCQSSGDQLDTHSILDWSAGNQICFLTNRQRFVLLRIMETEYPSYTLTVMRFEYEM
jgi:hypothetical protein